MVVTTPKLKTRFRGGLGSVVHTGGVSIGSKTGSRSRSGSPLRGVANQSGTSGPPSFPGNNPSSGGGGGSSFIPAPKGGIPVVAREKKHNADPSQSRPSSTSSTSSVSHLPVKSVVNGVTYRQGGAGGVTRAYAHQQNHQHQQANSNNNQLNVNNNNSMLDKFKLFNSKDKIPSDKSKSGAVSKRTSSSSGFSSARSERSDSSTSLCNLDGASSSSEPPTPNPTTTTTTTTAPQPEERRTTSRTRVPTTEGPRRHAAKSSPAVKSVAKKAFGRAKPIGTGTSSGERLSAAGVKGCDDDRAKKTPKGVEDRANKQHSSTLDKSQSGALRATRISNLKKVKSTSTLLLNDNKPRHMEANKSAEAEVSSPNGQSGPNSGIPKPTAAVKGTSKPAPKEESNSSCSNKGDDVYVPVTIPAPLTLTEIGEPGADGKANIPRSRSDRGRDGIAMVSPIMSNAKLESNLNMECWKKRDSEEVKESTAAMTSGSSTRDRELSDSGLRETSEDGDEVVLNIKPMLPILRASPYGYTRAMGPLSSSSSSNPNANGRPLSSRGLHVSSSTYSASSASQQRLANLSRHGLSANQDSRLFGAGVSSLKRVLDADYGIDGDVLSSDVHASGYLSDGDVLRLTSGSGGSSLTYGSCAAATGNRNQRQDEIYSCGYTSEGGASLYGRRVIVGSGTGNRSSQQKMTASGRNDKTINVLQDDSQHRLPRLDDSSSISSGVSDTINEFSTDDNLTGSSLSSEANNPYGSLKRGAKECSAHHRHHSENSTRSSRKQSLENSHHGSGGSGGRVSTKSSVKKTDSSMQTESSAFHHSNVASSAAWKKYMAQQQQAQQQALAAQEAHNHQGASGGKKKGGSSSSSSSSGGKNKSMAVVNGVTEAFKGKSNKLTLTKDDFKRPPVEGGSVKGSCESLPQTSGGGGKSGSGDKKGRSYSVSGSASSAAQGLVAYGQIKRSSGSLSNGSVIVGASNGQCNKSGGGQSNKKNKCQDQATKSTLERKGKVKVCANTQTTNQDLYVTGASALSDSEYGSLSRRHPGGSNKQHQYALTSPTLGGLRERSYGGRASSLTNNGGSTSSADYVTLAGLHSLSSSRDSRGPRLSIPGSGRLAGGSESDNYVSLDLTSNYGGGSSASPYAWIRPGASISSAASVASAPAGRYCGLGMTGGLTEADSVESLASAGSTGVHSQVNGGGGGLSSSALTHARLTLHQRELTPSPNRLSRSNSIRSTKSEKSYPSTLTRSGGVDSEQAPPYSVVTSLKNLPLSSPTNTSTSRGLTSQGGQRYAFPLSPVNPMSAAATPSGTSSFSYGSSRSSAAMSHYIGGLLSRVGNKDEDVHGSSLSLVSTSSSLYSTAEEKQAHEIRKLRRELEQAHEKVVTLTSQLTTNEIVLSEEDMSSYEQRSFSLPHPFRKRKLDKNGSGTLLNRNLLAPTRYCQDKLGESKLKVYTRSQDGATFYGLDSVEDAYSIESDKRLSLFGGSGELPDFYGGSSTFTSTSTSFRDRQPDNYNYRRKESSELLGKRVEDHKLKECLRCSYEKDLAKTRTELEPLWEMPVIGLGPCYAHNVNVKVPDKVVNWYDWKRRPASRPLLPAHMVAAFEQSLSNMTTRLQHLTASAEQKDSELMELRTTIEALRKQSGDSGLSSEAASRLNEAAAQRIATYHSTAPQERGISRQLSTDSVSSVNSMSSACSTASKSGDDNSKKKKSKKGWLRSSFSKAFSRSKKNRHGSVSDVEEPRQFLSDSSTPNSPLLGSYANVRANLYINNKIAEARRMNDAHSSSSLSNAKERRDSESSGAESKDDQSDELRKQLREKDMVLTDIRLEALTSAHQLEGLRETLNKMRNEMASLKRDNDRLQRLVSTKSLASSQSSLPLANSVESLDKRLSVSEQSEGHGVDAANDRDGKRALISVFQASHGDFDKFKSRSDNGLLIGSVIVSGKTNWDLLDNVVKKTFKEYVLRVDPVSNLGLNAESVFSYHVGDISRSKDSELPELLPCGYFVGENSDIRIVIKGTKQNSVDALAFETLIPKSIVQRYVSLLTEHRRIILCGPSGTGKTYLAQKLAEFLVLKNGKDSVPGTVATFSVDHKSAKELRQYLSNVAEQCESSEAGDLPTVIILDNLHHVGSLGEVFNGFLSAKYHKCPFIVGTMNQATCSTTNLQLHHNFRWVLCANHMEPVKGFLARYLRRKLLDEEIRDGTRNPELTKVVDWMPKVWQQLNKFLETHSSSDVTIGPRLFLSCPLDVAGSRVWFTDLWNYSIVPYLLEAVREGLQLYGRRAPWEDPAGWVVETYPWTCSPGSRDWPQLLRLRPEDVGYEGHPGPGGIGAAKNPHSGGSDVETDPLLNMLMRLQEAATYSSPRSNDSDSTSQDGHSACSGGNGTLHDDDVLNAGIESTL